MGGESADGVDAGSVIICDKPRVDDWVEGTPVMSNRQWFAIYKSCVDANNEKQRRIDLWEKWYQRELSSQEEFNVN